MIFLRKLVWVRADQDAPWQIRQQFVLSAVSCGADAVIVKPSEAYETRKLGASAVAASKVELGVGVVMLSLKDPRKTNATVKNVGGIKRGGKKVAVLVDVKNKNMEKAAVVVGKVSDFLLISTPDWKIIPLENLIAELQGTRVKILAEVKDAEEARVAVETLEVGAAGVVLDAKKAGPKEVKRVCDLMKTMPEIIHKAKKPAADAGAAKKLDLVAAKVTEVRPVGSGDRACIDTTSLMTIGEGMLVGSQAGGLFLVHSESLASEFVERRPFRVNAGAVHAYVSVPGGRTRYISELKAGDDVLIVNANGATKVAVVGRVKIERRPLMLVEAEYGGEIYKTLLQNAETINLVGKNKKPISVTKLKPGDKILLHVQKGGRHFGAKVDEMLVER